MFIPPFEIEPQANAECEDRCYECDSHRSYVASERATEFDGSGVFHHSVFLEPGFTKVSVVGGYSKNLSLGR
jgi:hypothetical protein